MAMLLWVRQRPLRYAGVGRSCSIAEAIRSELRACDVMLHISLRKQIKVVKKIKIYFEDTVKADALQFSRIASFLPQWVTRIMIQNIHTHADDAAGSASGYHTDTGGKACSICRQTQTEADFSNAQWVARAKTRTCNKCFDEAWKTDVYDRVKLARRACRSNAPDA